jgi:hypothetical protein
MFYSFLHGHDPKSGVQVLHAGAGEKAAARVAHGSQRGQRELSCVEDGAPPRGFRLRLSDLPLHAGVSTPLLLMPLGMVPSSDVSLLLSSVTGNPEVKRAIPATAHPVHD